MISENPEKLRLEEDQRREKNWKRWGPYLSERQWGTVREDYSPNGHAWNYFPHDHARSRAYRWGEDGLLGFTDRQCRLCFGLALWNGRDPFLKERLFGLSGPEGNHGEDVKECYFYLDSTPTHSYMKALYKYPQAEFPYQVLVEENKKRTRNEPEFELMDTGIFDHKRYFDIVSEYAKTSPNDILIRITLANRGPESATLHFLPTLWFRNTWAWGSGEEARWKKPQIIKKDDSAFEAAHETLGKFLFSFEAGPDGKSPELLFTENETNAKRVFGIENFTPYVKDAFHEYVISNQTNLVNPEKKGTKAAAYYQLQIHAGKTFTLNFRLFKEDEPLAERFGKSFESIFKARIEEAERFYGRKIPAELKEDERNVMRQAYAGLLWSKQFYFYSIKDWLRGDPKQPKPPGERKESRNSDWQHLYNRDVISMPDKWEFPWYGSWDLAFQMIPFAQIDPDFAKDQLILFLREWYMHPNGQMPAYEWNFSDVNPPVHAWACWRVYKMTGERGSRDRIFLERAFQKLLINFTWWVNRKDPDGRHLFSGGFLGLDNIGIFDRSKPLDGGHLEQADGTAWMAFYCGTMLSMALELAQEDPVYEDVASKFFEHFVAITDAINTLGSTGLWDEEDGFYYDQLHCNERTVKLRVRSIAGMIPLLAVEVLEEDTLKRLKSFSKRMQWFLENRPELSSTISYMCPIVKRGKCQRLLAIPSRERLFRVLGTLFDEKEFLSDFGIRSLSRFYQDHPFILKIDGEENRVEYVPGESNSGFFGGNSNWRGPIWFPLNYLLIEALERYHHFFGNDFLVEFPSGSGTKVTLKEAAQEIARRLSRIFLANPKGDRACHHEKSSYAEDPCWKNLVLFYEYFHGDTGKGLGASHQTGWTALIAPCIKDLAKRPGA